MKKAIYIGALACGFSLASCSSMQTLTLDQLHPAAITYPEQIMSVGVVNNMPSIPEPKSGFLTLGSLEGDGKLAAETLADALANSNYFNRVLICDSALQTKGETPGILTAAEVDNLSTMLGVDLLFSVERVSMKTAKKELYYQDFPMPFTMVEVRNTPIIRVYLPSRNTPMATITQTDSLYWELSGELSDEFLVKECTSGSVLSVVDRLVPHWVKTTRVYYDGGCAEMRDAAVYLRERNWEAARELWQGMYENRKKGKAKMKAAFNVALAYEMEGNIGQAIAWLKKAKDGTDKLNEAELLLITDYERILQAKQQDLPKLDMQMGRFDNNFQ